MTASDIDHIINHLSLKKSRRRWRFVALAAIVLGAVVLVAMNWGGNRNSSPHVARLYVTGLITGDEKQLDLIRDLRDDDNVKALIVRIDSPGGTTAGSEALYDALLDFGVKKPVVSVMDTVAASGGYITALATDQVFARGNTITGSIGVIFSYPDVSGLLGTLGVRMEEIKSGELKAEPSPYKPTSDKARAAAMVLVIDGFDWFKSLVQTRRKLTAEQVVAVSDGRVFTGRSALKANLIDQLGGETEALDWLAKTRNIDAALEAVTREPPSADWPWSLESMVKAAIPGFDRLDAAASAAKLDGLLVLWHPSF